MGMRFRGSAIALVLVTGFLVTLSGQQPAQPGANQDAFRFKSGVELVNVTATVSDASGRFVSGLGIDDFIVYEDDVRQDVTHFSAERVPGQPGHRARHERQHGRRQDRRCEGRAGSVSLRPARSSRTRSSSTASATARRCSRDGRPTASCCPARSAASRRTAARRCTTRWPKRSRWPARAGIGRRRSSSSPTATTRRAAPALAT